MKKLITIIVCLFVFTTATAQTYNSYEVVEDTILIDWSDANRAGSCASPDGATNVTIIVPPSYAWLQSNGYCYANSYGTNPTVCWTFTPTSSSVSLNSGYSTTGCINVSFGAFDLYNSACVLVGTGLNFTGLTPGVQYTWCITGLAWGGGPGCVGFTDFCPYYFNNVVLPVELNSFSVIKKPGYNKIEWSTTSEINNDYFKIERSSDGIKWQEIERIVGAGNSNVLLNYCVADKDYMLGTNYYRLVQVDFDGKTKVYEPKVVTNDSKLGIIKITTILGQIVNADYDGAKIYYFNDGTILKTTEKLN